MARLIAFALVAFLGSGTITLAVITIALVAFGKG